MPVFIYILAYFLGSLPSAYIIGKIVLGVDIRDYGSGNVGSTNALRVIGKKGGLIVFLMDFFKGFIAALIGVYFGGPVMGLIAGAIAMMGHIFPVWLKFKGGKGIATGLGALVPIVPQIALAAFISWALVLIITGYVSLGSVSGVIIMEAFFIGGGYDTIYIIIGAWITAIIIYRHWGNLKRIASKEEQRFFKGESYKIKAEELSKKFKEYKKGKNK